MLILYGGYDGLVHFAHEQLGSIRTFDLSDKDLSKMCFSFSDSTTVRFQKNESAFTIIPLKQGESFIAIKTELDKYNSDVLYMGVNSKWVVFGELTARGFKWV